MFECEHHWRDDAVLSRDLIDLAMMAPPKALLRKAIVKAQGAYGAGIEADLRRPFRPRANARTAWTTECRRCA